MAGIFRMLAGGLPPEGSILFGKLLPCGMAATDKTRLINEITAKVQELNLLLSTLKADRSRKPEALGDYRRQYLAMLKPKGK